MSTYNGRGHNLMRATLVALILCAAVVGGGGNSPAATQFPAACIDCHTMPPLDEPAGERDPDSGAFKGNHQTHAGTTAATCVKCHGSAAASYLTGHRTADIKVNGNINNSRAGALYARSANPAFMNQTTVPPVGNCSNVNCHFETATPVWGSAVYTNGSDCDKCHGSAPSAGHPSAGSKHGIYYGTGTSSCVKCHADHTVEAKPFAHATSVSVRGISVRFLAAPNSGGSYNGPTNDFLPSQTNVFGTCTNLYCHSNGRSLAGPYTVNTTPSWGGGTLNCNGCHGGPASLGSIINTGSHQAHVNNTATLGSNYGCVECHGKTVSDDATIATLANHVNGFIDYSGVKAGRSTTYSAGSCSASYCHTTGKKGKSGMAATVEPANPTWGGAALGCNGCHGAQTLPTAGVAFNSVAGEPNYLSGAAGSENANSHQKHVGSTGAVTCANCHSKTTSTGTSISAGSQHTDSFINYTAGNGKSFGKLANKTCSNISCHNGNGIVAGVGNAQWGGTLGCNGCHGGPVALASNILSTGKHTAHVNNAGTLGTNLGCVECHAKTVSSDSVISDPNKHLNAFLDYSGVKAGKSTSYSGGNCSATYCHSSGKKGQTGMTATVEPAAPSWSGAALSCNGCHGAQTLPTAGVAFNSVAGEPNYLSGAAGSASANSHQKHVGSAGAPTCANCHSKTTADGTSLIANNQHLNLLANYTSGNGKSFGRVAGKTCSNISCHSGNGIVANVANAQWGATLNCNGCHGGPAALGSNILNTGRHTQHVNQASVIGDNLGCVECHAKTVSGDAAVSDSNIHMNAYRDYSGVKAGGSLSYSGGTCSTSYCHTSGKKGLSGMAATVEPAAPSWSGAALGCNGCHGAQTLPTAGVAFNSVAGEPNYLSGAAGSAGANSHQKHVGSGGAATCANCHSKTTTNGTSIIAGSQHLNAYANYTAGNGKSFGKLAGKTCSNISCHSGNGIVAGVPDAQWGATLGCNGCHGGPVALGSNILATGKHAVHMNNAALLGSNYGCVECHAKTVSSDTTISDTIKHGNAYRDYSGAKAGGSSNYSGGVCSASYCHSSGKKGQTGMVATVEPAAPSWSGAALSCKGCHGAQVTPTAGVAFNSVAGEPNYVNGGSGANNANSHQKHVQTDGAITCVYCHSATVDATGTVIAGSHTNRAVDVVAGGGKSFGYPGSKTCSNVSCHSGSAFSAANAVWGTALDCKGCHATLSGAHTRHIGTAWNTLPFYNYTANLSSGADTDGLTWRSYAFGCANCHPVTLANHMNGTVEVENGQVTGGSSLRNKNTASGFIGSIGSGTLKCSNVYCHYNVTTPQWNQTYTAATRCSGCHENAPSTDSHAAHQVAIHYDDIYNGTTGLLPASGAVGVNAGHGDPAQSTTIGCNVCHYSTVTNARNKYNSSCSTASCHGNTTGSNADATGAARIANLAFHVNGRNDVTFVPSTVIRSKAQIAPNAFALYTGGNGGWSSTSRVYKDGTASSYDRSKYNLSAVGSYVGGNCSNIACHNGVTANWVNDFGSARDCTMCHANL